MEQLSAIVNCHADMILQGGQGAVKEKKVVVPHGRIGVTEEGSAASLLWGNCRAMSGSILF